MILLVLLACPVEEVKDTGPGGDTGVAADSGDTGAPGDSGETGDSAEPDWDCALTGLAPLTLPVAAESTLTATVVCAGSAPDSVELALEDGSRLALRSAGDGTYTGVVNRPDHGVWAATLVLPDGTEVASERSVRTFDTTIFAQLAPSGLVDMGETFDLAFAARKGAVTWSTTSDFTGRSLADGSATSSVPWKPPCDVTAERGICLFSTTNLGVVGADGTTLFWADLDLGAGDADIASTGVVTILDVIMGTKAPFAIGLDKSGSALALVSAGATKATSLAGMRAEVAGLVAGTSEVRLAGETAVVLSCSGRGESVFADYELSGGELLSRSDEGGFLECFVDTWSMALADLDNDGTLDQLHLLGFEDEDVLVGRITNAEGGSGSPVLLSRPGVRSPRLEVNQAEREPARWTYEDRLGNVFMDTLTIDKGAAVLGTPVFRGRREPGFTDAILGSLGQIDLRDPRPPTEPPPFVIAGRYLSGPGTCEDSDCRWPLALGEGRLLERTRSSADATGEEFGWVFDGAKLGGDSSASVFTVIGGDILFSGTADGTLQFGSETIPPNEGFGHPRPAGPVVDGRLWFWSEEEDGVQIRLADVADLAKSLRLNDLAKHLDSVSEPLVHTSRWLQAGSPAVAAAAGDREGEDDALLGFTPVGPSLVAALGWDTGRACPLATVLLPGLSLDGAEVLAAGVVLSSSDDPDCADLAIPLGRADLFGDGGTTVVLSDGQALRFTATGVHAYTYSDVTGFVAMTAADLNGDGLDDMILTAASGDRVVWQSAGDGTALGVALEEPQWSVAAGPISGDRFSPVTIHSWGQVLD
jgi:hypothetical protein